jgi:hypothetical protein
MVNRTFLRVHCSILSMPIQRRWASNPIRGIAGPELIADDRPGVLTTSLPFRIGPDLNAFNNRRPFLWDEAVVDVKWALLFPLKVVGKLLLLAVTFAIKEMVAAHKPSSKSIFTRAPWFRPAACDESRMATALRSP